MVKEIQFRRGSTSDHTVGVGFTGASAEVTVDTTNNTLRVHDGSTKGGHELVGVAATQRLTNKDIEATTFTVGVGTITNLSSTNLTLTNSAEVGSGVTITSSGIDVTGIITATSLIKSGGTSSQFLKADGSIDSNSYLADIVQDTTPQLGGNLDLNSKYITGTGGIDITGGLNISGITTSASVEDSKGEVRKIPQSTNTTIVTADAGKYIQATGTITIDASTDFAVGEAVTIFNNSGSTINITATGITMYQAGTANTGSRTLDQRGLCTILCVGTDTYVISGAGLA